MTTLKDFGRTLLVTLALLLAGLLGFKLLAILSALVAGISGIALSLGGALVVAVVILLVTRNWRAVLAGFVVMLMVLIFSSVCAVIFGMLAAICKFLLWFPGVLLTVFGAAVLTWRDRSGSTKAADPQD